MNISSVQNSIKEYGARIDDLLERVIPKDQNDHLSGPIWHHIETGGKRIRPALCLVTCEALGGDPHDAVHFALAVEILHNMFLLHDDIEDGDRLRRDEPTVWVKYGVPNAINAGDYMLAIAYRCVLNSPVNKEIKLKLLDIFTLTCEQTMRGQALDINSRADASFTVEDYIKIVELKTGYYFAFGIVGGAVIAGADSAVVDKLWTLGKNMGPAFQIRDDIIDLTKGKGRGGLLGSDIKEGKSSVLYALCLRSADREERHRLVEIMSRKRGDTTDQDVQWVISLYDKHQVMRLAQEMADKMIEEAHEVINEMPIQNKEALKEIAVFVSQRDT